MGEFVAQGWWGIGGEEANFYQPARRNWRGFRFLNARATGL